MKEKKEPVHVDYHYAGGIMEYVRYLNKSRSVLSDKVIYVEGLQDGILAEVALQYNDGYQSQIILSVIIFILMKVVFMKMDLEWR